MRRIEFANSEVAAAFETYTPAQPAKLLILRHMIFDVAETTSGVGAVEETLRWNQPSYLTSETGNGSTIRIDAIKNDAPSVGMYFHCQTGLVDHFRSLYPGVFCFEGNRAMIFAVDIPLPDAELRHCISLALTYHLPKLSNKKAAPK